MKRIIYYKQYGLGIGFSTDHARIGLIVNIVSAIDNNFFFFAKKKKNHLLHLITTYYLKKYQRHSSSIV